MKTNCTLAYEKLPATSLNPCAVALFAMPAFVLSRATAMHDLRLFPQLDTRDVDHQLLDLGTQVEINSTE